MWKVAMDCLFMVPLSSRTNELQRRILIRAFSVADLRICEVSRLSLELLLQDTRPGLHNLSPLRTTKAFGFLSFFVDEHMTPVLGFCHGPELQLYPSAIFVTFRVKFIFQ